MSSQVGFLVSGSCSGRRRPTAETSNRRLRSWCCRPTVGRCALRMSVSPAETSTGKAASIDRFLKVQNGSDVRGVTLDLNPEEPVSLPIEFGAPIAASFAKWVAKKKGKSVDEIRISVGRDSRLSGPDLLDSAAQGVLAVGGRVSDFGLATTPAMFMSTILTDEPHDGAIMLTASHLPSNRNGLKFFTSTGGTAKGDVKEILTEAAQLYDEFQASEPLPSVDAVEKQDFMAVYSAFLVDTIRKGCNHPEHYDTPLKGIKVLVDAGNGAGGFFASDVLGPLGADTTGSQFLDPDGNFPNHIPNPEDKVAMRMTSDAVLKNGSELGVVFDTDVDRSGVVDSQGNEINRNRLIAVLSSIVLSQNPGSTIVTDSVTSTGLANFIEGKGGKHFRYRRGYKNVIDKGVELNKAGDECFLAIETSGHGAMRENYFLDDGAYLAVKILIELVKIKQADSSRGVETLYKGLAEAQEAMEFRLKFKDPSIDFKTYGAKLLEELPVYAETVTGWSLEPVNHEGFRFAVEEPGDKRGWFLLRQSLHDPLLALNVESEVDGGVKETLMGLKPFLEKFDELDLSSLQKVL